jgi:hypothetical protein
MNSQQPNQNALSRIDPSKLSKSMATPILISEKTFLFEPLVDWPKERHAYISAWKLAFCRDGYEDRIDWHIGSTLNKTYVLRDQKGSIAAAYSLIRNQAICSGSVINLAICNNVFCIPEYQGLNLFVRIGRLSLADAESDYAFAYGFPNPAAIAGHKRVGWKFLDNAFNISISLVNNDISSLADVDLYYPVQLDQINEDERLEICSKIAHIASVNATAKDKLTIVKNKEYVYWRFFCRPKTEDRTYYVLNNKDSAMLFSVYHPHRQINILDFQASSDKGEQTLLKSLVSFACTSNIHCIKLFGCKDSNLAMSLKLLVNSEEDIVHYEGVNMIVNALGRDHTDYGQLGLPCSMSFLDNDVY